jgi:hypothetical protein
MTDEAREAIIEPAKPSPDPFILAQTCPKCKAVRERARAEWDAGGSPPGYPLGCTHTHEDAALVDEHPLSAPEAKPAEAQPEHRVKRAWKWHHGERFNVLLDDEESTGYKFNDRWNERGGDPVSQLETGWSVWGPYSELTGPDLDKVRAEFAAWEAGQVKPDHIGDANDMMPEGEALRARVTELEAENKRLRELMREACKTLAQATKGTI